jgi:hypothetical protein
MSAATQLTSRTHIAPINGRLTVNCSVEHFVPSGLTIGEMLNRLRGELVAAASAAAAVAAYVDPLANEFSSITRVGIDMDCPDPWLFFTILNPKKFLTELDEQFSRMQQIAARLIATNRPGVTLGGRHA